MKKTDMNAIPDKPGVYLFKDRREQIIYVGKALSLRRRLASYFDSSPKPVKTERMLKRALSLDYIITNNEVEALLLEANMIKTEKPRYNILLKDSKGYPYIKVTREDFPRVMFTRNTSEEKADYFGPFVQAQNLRGILKSLLKVFPLRSCTDTRFRQGKTCINYQIKRCKGPCEGLISKTEYNKIVSEIRDFFKGNMEKLQSTLKNEMESYAEKLMFEEAAEVRNRMQSLGKLFTNQKIVMENDKHIDCFVFGRHKEIDYVTQCFIRSGKLIGLNTKIIEDREYLGDDVSYVMQFYSTLRQFPEELFVYPQPAGNDSRVLSSALNKLSGKDIVIRQRGLGNLVPVAQNNGINFVEKYIENKDTVHQMTERFKKVLHLDNDIKTIQCVDISHLSGEMTVGASVFWDKSRGFVKNNYRKYNLKNLSNNDVEAVYQLVRRKAENIAHGSEEGSDIYIIDGGIAQLNAAVKAFGKTGINANICSISKGRSRSGEKFDFAESIEEIHVPGRKNSIRLKRNDKALLLAAKMRDEAHRFVITALRQKALKNYKKSPLLQIDGLGEKRLKILLTEFPDIYSNFELTAEEIAEKCSIPLNICERVLRFVKKSQY
ncbi:MAG TPA: hypothetical protein DHM44_05845 [Flexistipes sinusarabici]|uniref:UvrABC system protein C n=1 Tax=Flexistipes sinusarabici TaxID=2352 RepID=A0A3D5QBF5_FLESI|nr:hypothetical protein [Flexistipes sinusarabici]